MDILFDFDFIKNKIQKNRFLIGYSGGLDSTVLLYHIFLLKKEYKKNLYVRVIHINHNINTISKKWSNHCYLVCQQLRLNLIIVNLNKSIFNRFKKGGIESSARYIRHKIYNRLVLKDEIVLLGHHLQDQVETFFLSLKRSSGPRGLSGIKYISTLGRLTIFRPMLHISKSEIYSYAIRHNLYWIEDPSNRDVSIERNYIRYNLLPILRKKWPYIEKTISKSSFLCRLQEELLTECIEKDLNNLIDIDKRSLYIIPLLNMSKPKQYYVLRLWINKIFPNIIPSYKLIYHLLTNVVLTKIDSNPILKFKEFEIRKYRNYIYIVNYIPKKILKNIIIECYYPWKVINLPYQLGSIIQVDEYNSFGSPIIKPIKNERIFIKFARNPKVSICNINKSCRLNKFYKENYVPPWLRWRIPLLYYSNKLVASPNMFVCKTAFDKKENKPEDYIYLQWLKPIYF